MAMNPQQQAVFTRTSTVSPLDLTTLIASVVMTTAILWLAWMAYSQVRLWFSGQASFFDLTVNLARSSIVVLLLGFMIR